MAKILGIDIGYDSVKLALVSGKQVKKTAIASMPKRLMRDGRLASPEAMGELLAQTMKKNGIHCSSAAVAFSNEAVFVRNVTMPVMAADQLSLNLPYEFRDYITEELKNYIFDYAMLSDAAAAVADSVKPDQKAEKPKKEKKNALEAFEEQAETQTAAVENAAPTRKPAVPHAGSQIISSGVGANSSTIILMMWRGVRNWPFWPAVDSFPSIYSYRSPCMSISDISCSYKSSSPVMIFWSTCGVGMRNMASSI